jgi:hypothetical protein
MIHALIPSIVTDQPALYARLLKTAPVHRKTWTCSSPLPNDTQESSKWCDLRDRTAERNAETLERVQSISPEAGGLPAEVFLEKWLVWERKYSARRYGGLNVLCTHRQSAATVQSEGKPGGFRWWRSSLPSARLNGCF